MSCGKTDPLTLSSLTFLGYEFRKVRDRLFGTGKRYLHFGPSPKSVKRVCQEVRKHTHSRNVLLPVDVVVELAGTDSKRPYKLGNEKSTNLVMKSPQIW